MNAAKSALTGIGCLALMRLQPVITDLASTIAKVLLGGALGVISPLVHAEADAMEQAKHALYLFEESCFKNQAQPEKIKNWAKSATLHELAPDAAKQFLKRTGTAWNATNSIGSFVLAVDDDGLCSVFARKADTATIKVLVKGLLPKPPFLVTDLPSKRRTHPYGEVESVGYLIRKPDSDATAALILSVSESDNAPIQGMISMVAGRSGPHLVGGEGTANLGVGVETQHAAHDDGSPGKDERVADARWYLAKELDQSPRALRAISPAYPVQARQNQTEGEVDLSLKIDEQGEVKEAAVIRAHPPGVFDDAALAAFKVAHFSPGVRAGHPVKANILIRVKFQMDKIPATQSGGSKNN
jgi:TonB family protein